MSKPTYAELLRDPRWQRKRLEVMNREDFTCERCRDKSKTLNVHHSYYERGNSPWEYPIESLHCLCESCHEIIQEMMTVLNREIGLIPMSELQSVIGHLRGIRINHDRSIEVECDSDEVALGIGKYWGLSSETVIIYSHENNDGMEVVTGNDLLAAIREINEYNALASKD